jgi:hypothetical protein
VFSKFFYPQSFVFLCLQALTLYYIDDVYFMNSGIIASLVTKRLDSSYHQRIEKLLPLDMIINKLVPLTTKISITYEI